MPETEQLHKTTAEQQPTMTVIDNQDEVLPQLAPLFVAPKQYNVNLSDDELKAQRLAEMQRKQEEYLHEPLSAAEELLALQPAKVFSLREHFVQEKSLNQLAKRAVANDGLQATPLTADYLREQQVREAARLKALSQDKTKVRHDKIRHGFYKVIKGIIDFFTGSKRKRATALAPENMQYTQSLQIAYDEMLAMRLQAELDGPEAMEEFLSQHGEYFATVSAQVDQLKAEVAEQLQREKDGQTPDPLELERRITQEMCERQATSAFQQRMVANVEGGTKPVSLQHHQNGSRWLVKEAVSCIGIDEPFGAIVTEAGYKIQRIVNPDTAIEAHRGPIAGVGIGSYQRMVSGVKENAVDLFRFSRTPESMTDDELAQVQRLSPQILREHTTDWLLCNFDTKGENFLITQENNSPERLYGIDKEASLRRILSPEAQKMSKDYKGFDQDTVYNRVFQLFAEGKMDVDLQAVLPQIQRIEAMSNDEYMATFNDFISLKAEKDPENVEQIRTNILRRKVNLRVEYRDFFTDLVNKRIQHLSPTEARAARIQYFGAADGGTFLFNGETAEQWKVDQRAREEAQQLDSARLQREAQEMEEKDEKSYKRRHALYDFSKSVVVGLRPSKVPKGGERRRVRVPLSQVKLTDDQAPGFLENYNNAVSSLREGVRLDILFRQHITEEQWGDEQQELLEEQVTRLMELTTIEMTLGRQHEVSLGGTKPMSEHFGADGSRWLTKQAVNCMGYSKPEGALLTEAGAQLQMIVDNKTAVQAVTGETTSLGLVSFQRRLDNVESGEGKLDLFKFSKHPELATPETIAEVQQLSPQILREHTTDWLLCNFDTKGENFIITKKEGEERVLHGIDKEAAFNKILKPDAQHMSTTYKPHTNQTLYNVVFGMFAENKMNLDLDNTLPQIQKIEALEDDDYLALYEDFLAEKEKHVKHGEMEKIRENILQRKQKLREEYCNFFTELVNRRCKKLHPTDAAALRAKYFRGGDRFQF